MKNYKKLNNNLKLFLASLFLLTTIAKAQVGGCSTVGSTIPCGTSGTAMCTGNTAPILVSGAPYNINGVNVSISNHSGAPSIQQGNAQVVNCGNPNNGISNNSVLAGWDGSSAGTVGPNANTSFSITYTFSVPVNDIVFRIAKGGFDNSSSMYEDYTFSTNAGLNTLVMDETSCRTEFVSSNTVRQAGQANTNAGVGGASIKVHSNTPYTTVTITGPGGYGGSLIGICEASIAACIAPDISSISPANQSICAGEGAQRISVNSTGNQPLKYQWYKNSVNNNSGGTIINGATGSSYLPPITMQAGTTYYYVVVSNSCGEDVSQAVSVTTALGEQCDVDGDGVPNAIDKDNDNDGIPDNVECTESMVWMSTNTYTTTPKGIVTGQINGINFTYTSDNELMTDTGMYSCPWVQGHGVPCTPSIRNGSASNSVITFDQPMTDPVLMFTSIGSAAKKVRVIFSNDIEIVDIRSARPADLEVGSNFVDGYEVDVILVMRGTFSEVGFNYTVAESWNNFKFGSMVLQTCDTDGDGTPNYLDTDSDNDGCPDAVEGSDNVDVSQLNPNGSINSPVDSQGIPTLINPGGTADSDGQIGQGIGSSQNASTTPCQFSPNSPPDLTPAHFLSKANIAVGESIFFTTALSNVGESPTSDVAEFRIPKLAPSVGLQIVVNTNSTVNIFGAPVQLNHNNFDITENAGFFIIKTKPGVIIPAGGVLYFGLTITRTAGINGTILLNSNVIDGSGGGETPTNNNTITSTLRKI